jgi:hypothetical protein
MRPLSKSEVDLVLGHLNEPDAGIVVDIPDVPVERWHMVPNELLRSLSLTMHQGRDHGYKPDSWKDESYWHHMGHALGHIVAHQAGDHSERHLSHAACRLLMAEAVQRERSK